MPLFVTVTPGTTISNTTTLDPTTLNLLGTPSVDVTGTVDGGSLSLSAGSVGNGELAAHAVTFDKMQQISTDKLIGRDAALTGDATEIGVGGGLEFSGSNSIQIQNGTSTSTGVTYSKIQHVSATNKLLGRKSSGAGTVEEIGLGSGLTISGGNLNTTKQTLIYSNTVTVPSSGASVSAMNHHLGGVPNIFRVYALLVSGTSAGYQAGDHVPIEAIVTGDSYQAFTAWANSDELGLVRSKVGGKLLANKSTGIPTDIEANLGNWNLVFEAVRFT